VRRAPTLTVLALAMFAASAPSVWAEPDADAIEAAAVSDFRAGRFREAAVNFERLYRLRPEPATLFAIARAYQEAGDCERAREVFEDFVATSADPAGRRAAEERIAACRPPPGAEPAGATDPAVTPDPATNTASTPPMNSGSSTESSTAPTGPDRRRAWVLGLAASGLGVAVGAGVLELLGRGALDDAAAAGQRGDGGALDDAYLRANRYHYAAQVAAVAAVGLGVGAGVAWATRPRPRPRTGLAVAPRDGGALVSWRGVF
jgi:tetratricopeptide (TPR) repeat protein